MTKTTTAGTRATRFKTSAATLMLPRPKKARPAPTATNGAAAYQPGRMRQRLNGGVGRPAAANFQHGRFRNYYRRSQLPQQVKLSHAGQENHRRCVDDPECNHG